LKVKQTNLPLIAQEFLRMRPSADNESLLRAFHQFLKDWKIGFKDLQRAHIESFIRCPRGRTLSTSSKDNCRRALAKYLIWLHGQGLLCFDPGCFFGSPKLQLPQTVSRYIRSLEHNHKKSSLNGHRSALRSFHRWLERSEVSLDKLERRQIVTWLGHLSDSKMVPKTINHQIIFVRLFLRWLYEQSLITSNPDELIRTADMVKEPKYLPRPLPPAADKALQKRLANSNDIYSQGLLLMRRTGLRIGELISLEKNCVRDDHLGNRFLKVPLGKLNTERLVPLDDSALALINKLRGSDKDIARKTFLLETKTGKKTRYQIYIAVLNQACAGIDTGGKMVSHRLRHSFATTLLNAGMSLVGVMKLLGHNDHRMTLRYAEITQETAAKEYFEALSRIEQRYADVLNDEIPSETNPIKMLDDAAHLIQNWSAEDNSIKAVTRSIVKRIQRIQCDIHLLFPNSTTNR